MRSFTVCAVLILLVVPPQYADTVSEGSRASPDVEPWNITFHDVIPSWGGYAVGAVGRPLQMDIGIFNSGSDNAGNVTVGVDVLDFSGTVVGHWNTTVQDIPPGNGTTVSWSWVPQRSTNISVVVHANTTGDANPSNNVKHYTGTWWVVKWYDTCDDAANWTGDIGSTEWHITDTVEADPDSAAHSSPSVWYAGTEGILADHYTPGMNVSLISPEIDLSSVLPDRGAYLNFHYYGSTSPGDSLRVYILQDGAETDTRVAISETTLGWYHRRDDWIDTNGNGLWDEGEFIMGMDLSEFVGSSVRIRFQFTSTSTGLGYYLDDIILYGQEARSEAAVAGIENLGTTHVGENEALSVEVANLGDTQQNITVWIRVYSGDTAVVAYSETGTYSPHQHRTVTAYFTPDKPGDYVLQASIIPEEDSSLENNVMYRRIHVSEGTAKVLLVDDDGGFENSGWLNLYRGYDIEEDRAITPYIPWEYDVYHVLFNRDGPGADTLSQYNIVIWVTGFDGTGRSVRGTLSPEDQSALAEYLDGGGSLLLISQEVMYDLEVHPALEPYLKVDSYTDDAGTPDPLVGVEESPVASGLEVDTDVPVPGSDKADSLQPSSDAVGLFYQNPAVRNPNGPFSGITYNGSYRSCP